MSKKIRSKFKCNSVTAFDGGAKRVNFSAVYSDEGENADFAHATPAGTVEIHIDSGTAAAVYFKLGTDYYVDFAEVPQVSS